MNSSLNPVMRSSGEAIKWTPRHFCQPCDKLLLADEQFLRGKVATRIHDCVIVCMTKKSAVYLCCDTLLSWSFRMGGIHTFCGNFLVKKTKQVQ